jgi:predicted MFS family arabinose efflux permease
MTEAPQNALARSPVLAPFRVRGFRFQWPADLFTYCAFEMETLILGWYVLVATGSVLMLTAFGAAQYVGTLIAPLFGVAGDRIGHRNLLGAMRAVYAALAAILTALALAGLLTPAVVLIIAALSGLVRPSDQGMRSALVAETMPAEQLIAAMGVSRTTSDIARIVGALAGAGLFAALGLGSAYVAVTGCYLLGCLLTFGVPRVPPVRHAIAAAPGAPRRSAWHDLRDGIAYVWRTPSLLGALWLAFLVNLTAFPLSNGLLPFVAREVYGTNQTGLGYLAAGFASGALLGSIAVSLAASRLQPGRMTIVFAAAWYAALLAFAHMPSLAGGLVVLACAGFMQSLSMIPLAVILLRLSGETFRGRVMGVRMLAINSMPLGLLAAGALIGRIGFDATATLYAALGLAFTLVIALRWRAALWQADAQANAR